MEQTIRAILQAKGLKMSDLAEKVGMTQSNLVASIKKNPKLSTLQEIAGALNIEVAQLFQTYKPDASGLLIVNGKSYVISKPSQTNLQIATYNDIKLLRERIKSFISTSLKKREDSSISGIVESFELFTLIYNDKAQAFNLSICYSYEQTWTKCYDKEKYGNSESWDIEQLIKTVRKDIEEYVLTEYGVLSKHDIED